MDEFRKKLVDLQNLANELLSEYDQMKGRKSQFVGVFTQDQKVYLVEEAFDGQKYYLPSEDGINFDAQNKIKAVDYEKDSYYFLPTKLEDWNDPARSQMMPRDNKFDHANITILGEFKNVRGHLVLYDCSYITTGHQRLIGGAFLTSVQKPKNVFWRGDSPLWDEFVKEYNIKYIPLGAIYFNEKYYIYYHADGKVFTISFKDPFSKMEPEVTNTTIKRYHSNPILSPKPENHWENFAVFNPAAVTFDDKIHLFYRAQGHGHMSVVGYAVSEDGYNFDRHGEPVYIPDDRFLKVIQGKKKLNKSGVSGEGWGGCEDPRATIIDDTLYLIYVAFDGYSEPRLAMSKISLDDIRAQKWENWSDPVFLTPWSRMWGTGNKSGILFPEKVNGKYVLMHRYWPNICIDFVDDLDFGDGKKYVQTRSQIKVRKDHWDSAKIGAGAPPIKTNLGWLLIYFGVGYQDNSKYKIGAMILDHDNPDRVLYRSSTPIISPQTWYENESVIPGAKAGVTYPCGAVVKDGELIVYYGGADVVVCAASCELDEMLYDLQNDKVDNDLLKSTYVHS